MVTVFFAKIKQDWLHTTVSNRLHEFSQNIHNSKELFVCSRPVLILKLDQSHSLILRGIIEIHTGPHQATSSHTEPHRSTSTQKIALNTHTDPHRPSVALEIHTGPHRPTSTQKNALNTHTDPHRATMTQKNLLAVF